MKKWDKQKKIDKIYEVIADKTLSFWCRISVSKIKNKNADMINKALEWYIEFITERFEFDWTENWIEVIWNFGDIMIIDRKYKIIWHPVMIWDCLDRIEQNDVWWSVRKQERIEAWTMLYWNNKRGPIEDQSEECIDLIYNLLTK